MTIPEFIERCEAYRASHGVSQTWLSKRLFDDTFRLKSLADGKSDVGVKRLARAIEDLQALEATPADKSAADQDAA